MLGTKELLELVEKEDLVEDLCERERNNPEGGGFDLRVDEVFELKGDAHLGIEERHTPEIESIAKEGKDDEIVLKPGEYFLVKTMEKVNLPEDIGAIFRPRSTLQRCGVALFTAAASPGYSGELTFGIVNLGDKEFRLELGARIVHILFYKTGENVSEYRGQWNGGRVSTEGEKEVQV